MGHTDEPGDHFRTYLSTPSHDERDAPLSWMLGLQPNTRVRLRDFQGQWTIVRLNPGQVCVWRGDVYHNGLGYADWNTRVHGHAYAADYDAPEPALHTEEGSVAAAPAPQRERPRSVCEACLGKHKAHTCGTRGKKGR